MGLDCVGLVIAVWREAGLVAPDFDRAEYGRAPRLEQLLAGLRELCQERPVHERRPGDVLVFRIGRGQAHCGIYSSLGWCESVIHADARSAVRRVAETPLDERWQRRIVACFAPPECSSTPGI